MNLYYRHPYLTSALIGLTLGSAWVACWAVYIFLVP